MSSLIASFSREDVEVLIESVGDWESVGNQEYHVLNMIKNAPLPPNEHEAFEPMSQIKQYFRDREKEILSSRALRQETAVFLKAKLMLVRRDLAIGKLFDMAANVEANQDSTLENKVALPVAIENPNQNQNDVDQLRLKLKIAEDFIKGMGDGVVKFYDKFIEDYNNSANSPV